MIRPEDWFLGFRVAPQRIVWSTETDRVKPKCDA